MRSLFAALAMLAVPAALAQAPKATATKPPTTATAQLADASGKSVGTITFEQSNDGVLIKGDLNGIPPGDHAFHFHMVGKCEAPFKTAGDHFNPTKKEHGIHAAKGHHAGDLPNLHVPQSGALKFELFTDAVTLKAGRTSLFDKDGTAVMVHAKADDHRSQPAGDAGDRIACGVVQKGDAASTPGSMQGSMGKGEPKGTVPTMPGTDAGTMPKDPGMGGGQKK